MNERERWIVYPLLFLALGVALRDKLVDRTTTKSIVCQELSIVDEDGATPQSQRTLARIGRVKAKPGGKSTATFQMNGDLEIVNDDLSETIPARILVRVGRTDAVQGVPSAGLAYIRGGVEVDGVISALQYLWRGIPVLPMHVVPGTTIPNMQQAMPQGGPRLPNPTAPQTNPAKPPQKPPATGSPNADSETQPSSPAGDSSSEK